MLQPATTQPAQRRDPSQSQESPSPEDGDDDGGDDEDGDDDGGGGEDGDDDGNTQSGRGPGAGSSEHLG